MASKIQSDTVFAEIRRRILVLEIRPEERLKEEEWARNLSVGRLTVREALTRLHGEGLLARGAKGGFFAAPMTAKDVAEIRHIRQVFVTAAVRLGGPRLTAKQVQELETACDDFAYMVKQGYHAAACEADRRFHALIVAASGNGRLIRAYERSHIPLFHIRLGQTRGYMDDYEDTEREHRAIAAALKAGKIDRAVDLLRAHFARGSTEVLSRAPGNPAMSGS